MSGREKVYWTDDDGTPRVGWVELPDEDEPEEEPEDLWPELMLALEVLTAKQRFVIECRYGLRPGMVGEGLPLEEIADLMGVSVPAVKQMEVRAIERMQTLTARILCETR